MHNRLTGFLVFILVCAFGFGLGAAHAQEISPPADTTIYILNSLLNGVAALLAMFVLIGFAMRDTGVNRAGPAAYRILTFIGAAGLVYLVTWLAGYGIEHGVPDGGILAPVRQWWFWSPGAELRDPELLTQRVSSGIASASSFDFLFSALTATVPVMIMVAAVSGRIRETSVMIVTLIMAGFFFPIVRGWLWGGGFLNLLGFVDVGGGALLHVAGGLAGLTGALVLGLKKSDETASTPPSAAGAALGSLLLWVGLLALFMGRTGDASSVNNVGMLGTALVNAQIASAAAVLSALVLSSIMLHRADELVVINAAIGGLVAISADPAAAGLFFTLFIGVVAGFIVTLGMLALQEVGIDDMSGALPAHLFCGIWGVLIAALYSEQATILGQIGGLGFIVALVTLSSALAWLFAKATFGFALPKIDRRTHHWRPVHKRGGNMSQTQGNRRKNDPKEPNG